MAGKKLSEKKLVIINGAKEIRLTVMTKNKLTKNIKVNFMFFNDVP